MKLVILIILAYLCCFELCVCSVKPIELVSIPLDRQSLHKSESPRTITITHKFSSQWEKIVKGKVIGSISKMNILNDTGLQFNFKYGLNSESQRLEIEIFINPNQTLSEQFLVVLDFMVAEFPQDYRRFILNMTEYQEHIMMKSNRSYELITFLNGFSNVSLSGNITHAYNLAGQMYTIHYMSCVGEEKYMGWQKGKDYVLFTAMVVPVENLVQKFHLYTPSYEVNKPESQRYFYGYKGVEPAKFGGYFEQNLDVVRFKVIENPEPSKSYGIIFLPFSTSEDLEFLDYRQVNISKGTSNNGIIGISVVVSVIFLCLTLFICYKMRKLNESTEETIRLNQNTSFAQQNFKTDKKGNKCVIISEQSENRGPQNDQSLKMNTVEEVDPEYEESLRGTGKIKNDDEGPQPQKIEELDIKDDISLEDD